MFSIPDIIFVLSVLDYLFGFNFISSSFHSKQYKYMQFAHLFLLFVYFLLFLSLLYVVTLLQFLVNMFFLSRIFTLLYNAGSDFSSKLTIVIVILNDRRKRNMTCWYVLCSREEQEELPVPLTAKEQGWEFTLLLKITLFKEQSWTIHSCHSLKESYCERIALVALYKEWPWVNHSRCSLQKRRTGNSKDK